MDRHRQYILGGLLALFVVLSLVTLSEILGVVVFAITVAYVLYPLREMLTNRGLPRRIASAVTTSVAFLVVVLILAPLAYAVYDRQEQLIAALEEIPETVEFDLVETTVALELEPYIDTAEEFVSSLAVDIAFAAPALALELTVFTLLVYAILYRPSAVRNAIYKLVPTAYHDILTRLHRRTKTTLFTIYILQALTAVVTFLVAAVVFWLFGLSNVLWFAIIAGLLQFIPIVGPSILIALLVVNEYLSGDQTQAILLAVIGLVVIGFIPDAIIRTKLADYTGEIAGSLYFVGFVGGILTIGPIGVIVGPLVIALLVEVVRLLSETNSTDEPVTSQESEAVPAEGHTDGEQKST
jgi:predicted PurR-regulated permease PerM